MRLYGCLLLLIPICTADYHKSLRFKRQSSTRRLSSTVKISLPLVKHDIIGDPSKSNNVSTTINNITVPEVKSSSIQPTTTASPINVSLSQKIEIDSLDQYSSKEENRSQIDDSPSENPEFYTLVATSYGLVKGIIVRNNVVDYYSFRGIPYAEKPVRFQAPVPPKSWKGVKDSTKENKPCLQKDDILRVIGGSEDCLYLNVNTPTLADKRLPVVVWIHGGAFKFGSGSTTSYGPEYLINEGLVVVNVYYRLGVFGFLSTRTEEAPGNAGLKDVVAALKWLKINIHMFGGDTNNICLYGVSSGSSMVEYLTISPMAKGLFEKAIQHSGSVLNPWSFTADPLTNAFSLGYRLGFEGKNIKNLVNFLQNANGIDIVAAAEKMDSDIISPYGLHFTPSVEQGDDGFLLDFPEHILKSGDYAQVPTMIGFNNNEGFSFIRKVFNVSEYITSYNDLIEYVLPPDILMSIKRQSTRNEIIEKTKQFYLKGESLSIETLQNYVDLLGDSAYLYASCKTIKIRSEDLRSPMYCYEFALGDVEPGNRDSVNDIHLNGAAHSDDVSYVFGLPMRFIIERNEISKNTSMRLLKLFSNFFKYGNPTPSTSELLPIILPQVSNSTKIPYLSITENLEMKYNPYKERCDFFSQLYSLGTV
ncbi:juvenile hormone esterase-like [Arctopsyche grandis]|uniref:juvenile hormone esterase-like n=1 Tax=Arctopsyche grandis TaxID=121162 RepID=UPI00406D91E6